MKKPDNRKYIRREGYRLIDPYVIETLMVSENNLACTVGGQPLMIPFKDIDMMWAVRQEFINVMGGCVLEVCGQSTVINVHLLAYCGMVDGLKYEFLFMSGYKTTLTFEDEREADKVLDNIEYGKKNI